jgi:predicted lipid-binding transport protein (Tim44 family)
MRQFFVGLVLKFVLGKVAREPAPAAVAVARRPRPTPAPPPQPRPGRSRLLPVMLGSLGLGLPLMLLFENTFTRIAGVLLCFAFIISGVFVIANPADLGREGE